MAAFEFESSDIPSSVDLIQFIARISCLSVGTYLHLRLPNESNQTIFEIHK